MQANWPLVALGTVAKVEMGQSPPSDDVFDVGVAGLPFLQGNAEFGPKHPEPRLVCRRPLKRAYPGDSLISVRAPVGAINFANQELCIGRGLSAIRFPANLCRFGYHALAAATRYLRRVAQGTTFEAVGGAELRALRIPGVSSPVADRIADILDTVDDAIRQTERVIAKLEQVKVGMLQDLLTRGIDDNGAVRDPERHPEQFKDSPLGRIPKEWEVVSLKSVVQADRPITYGIVQPGAFHGGGIPMIRGQDYSSGVVDARSLFHVHPSVAAGYRRSRVRGGDLLLSIVGYVGLTAEVPEQLSGANLTQTTARIAISPSHSARFFLHYFRGRSFRREIVRYTKGSAQPGLNLADVERFQVLCPPHPEQERVARSLDLQNSQLSNERVALAKLRATKQALADDLLTGRVRVNPREGVPV